MVETSSVSTSGRDCVEWSGGPLEVCAVQYAPSYYKRFPLLVLYFGNGSWQAFHMYHPCTPCILLVLRFDSSASVVPIVMHGLLYILWSMTVQICEPCTVYPTAFIIEERLTVCIPCHLLTTE